MSSREYHDLVGSELTGLMANPNWTKQSNKPPEENLEPIALAAVMVADLTVEALKVHQRKRGKK